MKQSFINYLQLESRLITTDFRAWSRWQSLQKVFVKEHNYCEMCGWKKKLNVHHIVPRHVDSSLALDWNNLITLCRECHFRFGHFLNWQSYNPYIVELVNSKHKWASIMMKYMNYGEDIIVDNMDCQFCGGELIMIDDEPFIECVNGHSFDIRSITRN